MSEPNNFDDIYDEWMWKNMRWSLKLKVRLSQYWICKCSKCGKRTFLKHFEPLRQICMECFGKELKP